MELAGDPRARENHRVKRGLVFFFLAVAALAQPEHLRIGSIDFFGYTGLDLNTIRQAVPVQVGEQVSEDEMPKLIAKLKQITKATDVATVCCDDKGGLMIYIGLPGQSSRSLPYNAAPEGAAQLPQQVRNLYQQFMDALIKAVEKGASGEDDSQGYALFTDAATRARQLPMVDYARLHESRIRQVLESSSDAEQRAIAAQLMGYVRSSPSQINALVRASHDPDSDVRNNAVRALGVLAGSSPKKAAQIPAASFIEMLYSGSWTDRNKASLLLETLTRGRDPKLLGELREQASAPLREMAGWHSAGHAYAARMILGRCEGIEEARLQKLVAAGELPVK
jgi:hypothetical protein